MPLSEPELAELAVICMAFAERELNGADSEFEDDARLALRRVAEDSDVQSKHPAAARAIRRALTVKMDDPANRKGGIPLALGLVTRRSKLVTIKQWAIVLMLSQLLDQRKAGGSEAEPAKPYSTLEKAVDAVVDGFFLAEIDPGLTAANVERIWFRLNPGARRTKKRRFPTTR